MRAHSTASDEDGAATSEEHPNEPPRRHVGRAPTHQERGVAGDSDPVNQGLLLQQAEGAPGWRVQSQGLFENLQKPYGETTREIGRRDTSPRPISAPTQGAPHTPTSMTGSRTPGRASFAFEFSLSRDRRRN